MAGEKRGIADFTGDNTAGENSGLYQFSNPDEI